MLVDGDWSFVGKEDVCVVWLFVDGVVELVEVCLLEWFVFVVMIVVGSG